VLHTYVHACADTYVSTFGVCACVVCARAHLDQKEGQLDASSI